MKRNEEPTIVSLETHRRRRQAEGRQKKKAKPARPPVFAARGAGAERAVNWRRVPLFAGVLIAFMVLSWLLRQLLALSPLH